jgi:hypothetical protein
METDGLGAQGFTDEDARYRGTRFAEVRDAIFANSYQKVWAVLANRRCRSTK